MSMSEVLEGATKTNEKAKVTAHKTYAVSQLLLRALRRTETRTFVKRLILTLRRPILMPGWPMFSLRVSLNQRKQQTRHRERR